MFTVEESTLLARMLRAVAWILVCLIAGLGSCFAVHRVHHDRGAISNPQS